MSRFTDLFPIDTTGDGNDLCDRLATLLCHVNNDPNIDIHAMPLATGILVALKLYETESLEAALAKLDRLISMVGGPKP